MPAGAIPVPAHFVLEGQGDAWVRTDWWQTAYWYLNCSAERAFEAVHGPIHSYSNRLTDWDPVIWERAWVNRIALFMRRWVAQHNQVDEDVMLGSLPETDIQITHDVDAIQKTPAIRLKQSAFNAFNGMRRLLQGKRSSAMQKFRQALLFFSSNDNYWFFDKIAALEEKHGLRSSFNLYGGGGGWLRSPKKILLDPAYDVRSPRLASQMRALLARGWQVGLHQSFDEWSNPRSMCIERLRVEQAIGQSVTTCRQHWLRFSWERTWIAQREAGFLLDTTLGFNDRPAFRCGAALRFKPVLAHVDSHPRTAELEVVPMVLMDSHLYDYLDLNDIDRQTQLKKWLDEIRLVRGQATVIWHTHVLGKDYGWSGGFDALLHLLDSKSK